MARTLFDVPGVDGSASGNDFGAVTLKLGNKLIPATRPSNSEATVKSAAARSADVFSRVLALATLFVATFTAEAQQYKCPRSDGTITYQQVPCNRQPPDSKQTAEASRQKAGPRVAPKASRGTDEQIRRLVTKCATMKMDSDEYLTCITELSCVEDGQAGKELPRCIDQRISATKRYEEATRPQTSQSKVPEVPTPSRAPEPSRATDDSTVSCTSLSLYAKALGHGFFERIEIVNSAKRRGQCRDVSE